MYQAIEKEVFGYISRGDNFLWYNVYDFYPTRYVFCVPLIKARGQKTHNELVKEKSSWSYSITNHDKSTQYTYYHGEDPILIPTPFINQKNHKTPSPRCDLVEVVSYPLRSKPQQRIQVCIIKEVQVRTYNN